MTGKTIEPAIVIDVGKVAGLHKDANILGGKHIEITRRVDVDDFDIVILSAYHHILMAIVVDVPHAHAPLILIGDFGQEVETEAATGLLIADVEVAALMQDNEVIEAVIVQVCNAGDPAAEEGLGQQAAVVGELGPGSGRHAQCEEPRNVKCFHERTKFWIWFA